MKKYAICGALLAAIVGGAYYSGYSIGSNKRQIEYVEKIVEVIKHVEVERGKIYSAPNIGRDSALRMFHNGKL